MRPEITVICLAVALHAGGFAQEGERSRAGGENQHQIIWRDPGDVASLDFAGGKGGRQAAPQPPFVFSEELSGGTSAKVIVTDATRRKWTVKWGEEVKPETFASRLAWATGYHSDPAYFLAQGQIDSAGALGRAAQFIDRKNGGYFRNARFELITPEEHRMVTRNWSLVDNPFVGTPELHGLKILMMLVSNWDVKDSRSSDGPNTSIIEIGGEGAAKQLIYAVDDWGGSMGKWGDFFGRSKWDCKGYASQSPDFVKGVDENGFVGFGFSGKRTADMVNGIKVDDVKWVMQYLGRITDDQLRAGLQASGASGEEVKCFSDALRSRINQLAKVAGGPAR